MLCRHNKQLLAYYVTAPLKLLQSSCFNHAKQCPAEVRVQYTFCTGKDLIPVNQVHSSQRMLRRREGAHES